VLMLDAGDFYTGLDQWLPCDFDLADRDVNMPRLVAVSRSDMRAVDQHDHFVSRIDVRLGIPRHDRLALEISRSAIRSTAHRRVTGGLAWAKAWPAAKPRLPVGMPGAQFGMQLPELGRATVR
jgi:hypothetical protein